MGATVTAASRSFHQPRPQAVPHNSGALPQQNDLLCPARDRRAPGCFRSSLIINAGELLNDLVAGIQHVDRVGEVGAILHGS
jgi:hypothetical protein